MYYKNLSNFDYNNKIELLTYLNQEMLKRGFLTNGGTATTFAYSDKIISEYQENVTQVFKKINALGCEVEQYLQGPIKHTTFERLTD